jgi:hypothetical protein
MHITKSYTEYGYNLLSHPIKRKFRPFSIIYNIISYQEANPIQVSDDLAIPLYQADDRYVACDANEIFTAFGTKPRLHGI